MKQKNILVLARRDHSESMRVAAGLTISGHKVRLIFMTGPIKETEENLTNMELLELSDIVPETTIEEMIDSKIIIPKGRNHEVLL